MAGMCLVRHSGAGAMLMLAQEGFFFVTGGA